MWAVVTALLLATPVLGNYLNIFHGEPENIQFERSYTIRRHTTYLECPPRAVCGVGFDFNRTVAGVLMPERRMVHHCTCPGGTECPFEPTHRVFASIRTREYMCRPISTMFPCDDETRVIAKELVGGSENFDLYPYFRINCLCPRHTNPMVPKRSRDMELATEMTRVRWDFGRGMSFQENICKNVTQVVSEQVINH